MLPLRSRQSILGVVGVETMDTQEQRQVYFGMLFLRAWHSPILPLTHLYSVLGYRYGDISPREVILQKFISSFYLRSNHINHSFSTGRLSVAVGTQNRDGTTFRARDNGSLWKVKIFERLHLKIYIWSPKIENQLLLLVKRI